MYLVAHRGLQTKNTKENTLAAIKLGDSNSMVDGVEIDVRLTKDNNIVVIHDDNIERVSNGRGFVREMSLDRLKRFNYGSFLKRATISTLDEVLREFSNNTILIIELKDENNKNEFFASKVLEITSKYPNLNICFKSFSKDTVLYLKKNTNRPVGILIGKNNLESLNLNVDFYSLSKTIIKEEILNNELLWNKPIMVWTINFQEEMERVKKIFNDRANPVYIISDNPLLFKIKN